MANFLDKMKIKTAVDERTKLDLSCDHITTANFMQFNVAWSKELVPKEKISVNMETFTRLQPLPVPTFGRCRINNRAFFVPFRTIFPAWNDFITDTKHVYSSGNDSEVPQHVDKVPTVTMAALVSAFTDNDDFGVQETYDSTKKYDFVYFDEGNTDYVGVTLTAAGRQALKVLESLGYKVGGHIWFDDSNDYTLSALPLFAIAKIYMDWYYPSAYTQDAVYTAVEQILKNDNYDAHYNVTPMSVYSILKLITYVNYDSDYFVSAWDNPVNPNSNASGTISFGDVTGSGSTSYTAPGMLAPLTSMPQNTVSQWAIDALKSLTDYMKRHQLVGARALDRYLARFGVNLPAEKLNRCIYLGMNTSDIQFGDVMSTADTDGAALGNYAGKGIGFNQSSFEFETDEYGLMIIVSTIIPKTGYFQGINRNVMHIGKTDFWTPEFDNLGTQAISKAEVIVPQNVNIGQWYSGYENEVFGWTPRYAEYKVGRDMLTGDFRNPRLNVGLDSWYTMRELNYEEATDVVHNVDFVRGIDAGQYSRIFYNTDADVADKFNVIYHFNIASWSPMKSLFDTYEFDSKGKEVTEDVNGVKMN